MAVVCSVVADIITSLEETDESDPLLLTLKDYPNMRALVENPTLPLPEGTDIATSFVDIVQNVISEFTRITNIVYKEDFGQIISNLKQYYKFNKKKIFLY